MHEALQISQMHRSRTSRRSRPSLAEMPDSGYQPSRPQMMSHSHNPLQRSISKNTLITLTPQTVSDPFDLGIASQLLGDDSPLKDPRASTRSVAVPAGKGSFRTSRSSPFSLDGGLGANSKSASSSSAYPETSTLSRSQTISSAWSGMSNRLFAESANGSGNERPTDIFTKEFDKLAKKHGIQPFPESHRVEPGSVSVSSASQANKTSGSSTPSLPGSKLWNKLLRRTPSSIDVSKKHGNMKMSLSSKRAPSISDLAAIAKGKRDSLKGMHLEDIIRLGGVSPFILPPGLAPGDLLIPTCMHAAASYILHHGLKTPGLFRVAGNLNTTYSLYDFYQKQFEKFNNEQVVQTTAVSRLPSHIHYNIHDVAHLFKKLLYGLPGGLLGSPAIFQALYNVHSFVFPDPSLGDHVARKVKPRMIALAIASINLHFRISLICAVFGLLRAVSLASESEAVAKIRDPHDTFTSMKEDALGIIFGPLLLGDKSDQIILQDLEDRGGLLVLPKITPSHNFSSLRSKYKNKHSSVYSKVQLEKTKRAALVCEMLINSWEDIAYQLRKINALGVTAQAYDLPSQIPEQPAEEIAEYAQEQQARPRSTRSSRTDSRVDSRADLRTDSGAASQRTRSRNNTIRSVTGTIRSVQESPEEEPNHNQFHTPPAHKPHVEDLMRFSTHNLQEQDTLSFNTPLGIAPQMSPVPELASPERSPDRDTVHGSPNWVIIPPLGPNEPDTPTLPRHQRTRFEIPHEEQSEDENDGATSSGSSSNHSSPDARVRPQIATRFQRTSVLEISNGLSLSAPDELESRRGSRSKPASLRIVDPIPELAFASRDVMSDPEGVVPFDRSLTPKPLNFRKKTKTPPAFSIFEDETRTDHQPPPSPTLTLTKPGSKVEIKLDPTGPQSLASRRKPPHADRPASVPVPLQLTTPNRRPRATSVDSDFEDRYLWRGGEYSSAEKKASIRGNSALYAEIRRLQRLVDIKTEEANQWKKELELAKNMANAGTLSQLLREAQDETKVWRNRAEWAEKQLRNKIAAERKTSIDYYRSSQPVVSQPVVHGHRYSLG